MQRIYIKVNFSVTKYMYRKKKKKERERKEKGKETPNYYRKVKTHTQFNTVVTKHKLKPNFKGCALR